MVFEYLSGGRIKFHSTATGSGGGIDFTNLVVTNLTVVSNLFVGTNLVYALAQGTNILFVTNGQVLTIHGTATGGSGEVNTSSNVGDGVGVAAPKVGVDLPFKSFKSASGAATWTTNATNITLTININTNAFQPSSGTLTNLAGTGAITNLQSAAGIQLGTNAGIIYITNLVSGMTNGFQPASSNLTNWATIPTNILANFTNFITAVQAKYFEVVGGQLNLTNFNLTNWANISTNIIGLSASNGVTVAAGTNIVVQTNSSGSQMIYTVSGVVSGSGEVDFSDLVWTNDGTAIRLANPYYHTVSVFTNGNVAFTNLGSTDLLTFWNKTNGTLIVGLNTVGRGLVNSDNTLSINSTAGSVDVQSVGKTWQFFSTQLALGESNTFTAGSSSTPFKRITTHELEILPGAVVGYVWTATNVNGLGAWSPPGGGTVTFSDLVFTNDGTNIRHVNVLNRNLSLNPTNTSVTGSGIIITGHVPALTLVATNNPVSRSVVRSGESGIIEMVRVVDHAGVRVLTNGNVQVLGPDINSFPASTIYHFTVATNDFSGAGAVNQFGVTGHGNIGMIRGLQGYVWPAAHAVGALTNDGTGVLGYYDLAGITGGGADSNWTNITGTLYPVGTNDSVAIGDRIAPWFQALSQSPVSTNGSLSIVGNIVVDDNGGAGSGTIVAETKITSLGTLLVVGSITNPTLLPSRLVSTGTGTNLVSSAFSDTDVNNLQGATNQINIRVIALEGITNHLKVTVQTNGVAVGFATNLNFLPGSGITLNATNVAGTNTIFISSTGGSADGVTNIVSLSTSNAVSKPLTNSFVDKVATFRGLEAGANISITANASNYVIAAAGSPSSLSVGSNGIVFATGVTNLNFVNVTLLTNDNGDVSIDPVLGVGDILSQNGSTIFPTHYTNGNGRLTLGTNSTISSAFIHVEVADNETLGPSFIATLGGVEVFRIETNGQVQANGFSLDQNDIFSLSNVSGLTFTTNGSILGLSVNAGGSETNFTQGTDFIYNTKFSNVNSRVSVGTNAYMGTIRDYHLPTAGPGQQGIGDDANRAYLAVRFLATNQSYFAKDVAIWLFKNGSPTYTMKASIWNEGDDVEPLTQIGPESEVIYATNVSNADITNYIAVGINTYIQAGSYYWLVLRAIGAPNNGSDYIGWLHSSTTGGNSASKSTNGTWSTAGLNRSFQVLAYPLAQLQLDNTLFPTNPFIALTRSNQQVGVIDANGSLRLFGEGTETLGVSSDAGDSVTMSALPGLPSITLSSDATNYTWLNPNAVAGTTPFVLGTGISRIEGELAEVRHVVDRIFGIGLRGEIRSTAGMSTNAASFPSIVTNLALNTYYTNRYQRGTVGASVWLAPSSTNSAEVALYLDQNFDGTWEQTGIAVTAGAGIISSNRFYIHAELQPGARFILTNLTVGTAVATLPAGASQWTSW